MITVFPSFIEAQNTMQKFIPSLLFSFFVALSMVVLDMLFHLATETAVHVNYVAVKFTLIFLILFLVTWWVQKGFNEALFACLMGPGIFYIYYVYADPTLNRVLFKIDDSFGYIFLHIAVFLLAYWLVFMVLDKQKGSREVLVAGKAAILTLLLYGLDALYQMQKVQLLTKNEELVAQVLHIDTSLYLILLVFVVGFLCVYYFKSIPLQSVVFIIASALSIFLLGHDLVRAMLGIVSGAVPLFLVYYYEHISGRMNAVTKRTK